MKKNEIKVGRVYIAKVAGKVTTVRVDTVRGTVEGRGGKLVDSQRYDVTNLITGRKITFQSAARFWREVPSHLVNQVTQLYK